MEVACDIEMIKDPESRRSNVTYVARHIEDALMTQREYRDSCSIKCRRCLAKSCCLWFGKRYGNYLVCLYLIIKSLYIINVVGQFFLMNKFLGTNYTFYGLDLLRDISEGYLWQESGHFPRITMCDFEIRKLANIHRHTVQCVLPINMFNEKIFIFLWFWFILVAAINSSSFLYWSYKSSFRANRIQFVRKFLKLREALEPGDKKRSFAFVDDYLRQDGIFIIRLVAQNAGELVASEITECLWRIYKQKQLVINTTHLHGQWPVGAGGRSGGPASRALVRPISGAGTGAGDALLSSAPKVYGALPAPPPIPTSVGIQRGASSRQSHQYSSHPHHHHHYHHHNHPHRSELQSDILSSRNTPPPMHQKLGELHQEQKSPPPLPYSQVRGSIDGTKQLPSRSGVVGEDNSSFSPPPPPLPPPVHSYVPPPLPPPPGTAPAYNPSSLSTSNYVPALPPPSSTNPHSTTVSTGNSNAGGLPQTYAGQSSATGVTTTNSGLGGYPQLFGGATGSGTIVGRVGLGNSDEAASPAFNSGISGLMESLRDTRATEKPGNLNSFDNLTSAFPGNTAETQLKNQNLSSGIVAERKRSSNTEEDPGDFV